MNFTALGQSYRSEVMLSINDSFNGLSGFWDFAPSADDAPGVIASGPFTMTTGTLYIEAFETFDDGGVSVQDARIDAGTLRIYYVPVPAPGAAAALVGLGGLVAMRRRR